MVWVLSSFARKPTVIMTIFLYYVNKIIIDASEVWLDVPSQRGQHLLNVHIMLYLTYKKIFAYLEKQRMEITINTCAKFIQQVYL